MKNYTDVLIRIRAPKPDDPSLYPVEAQIDGSGSWRGESAFDFTRLDPGKQTKQEYGALLGRQLLNPSIARALEQAGAGQGKPVHIRLLVDEEVKAPHWIRWERMYLRIGAADWPIAISPEIPFSRYIPDERPDSDPPPDNAFRLLFAVANPADLPDPQRIDVAAEIENLLNEFESALPATRFRIVVMPGITPERQSPLLQPLQDRLKAANWGIADGPASLDNISEWLHRDGGYHALHIVCHGNFKAAAQLGLLYLQNEDGATAPAKDYELQSWIHPKLQLIVFQACRTAAAAPEGEPPFVGIAPKIVKSGVPAVVAMQDFILMSDARAFSRAFYRALLRDGLVHVAVNEGRQAVPNSAERVDSTIPALFMRLRGGRLWRRDPVRQEVYETRDRLGEPPSPPPLRVVQHSRGLEYDPSVGPEGTLYDANTRINELIDRNTLTCLTGPAGFDKAGLVHLAYWRLSERYLSGADPAAPVLLGFAELATWGRFRAGSTPGDLRGNLQAAAGRHSAPDELKGRRFVFLIEADRDLTDDADTDAVETILQLLRVFPGSRALMVYDEASINVLRERLGSRAARHDADDSVRPALLVAQAMEWPDLKRFLIADHQRELADVIEARSLSDIANAPWILSRLREFAEVGRYPANRADALRLIASSYLVSFDTQKAPRGCAEQALERIAWQLQCKRALFMDTDTLLSILAEVRDRRDFRLGDLRDGLIRCQILAPSGEESVRFGYRALQAYYAARYVQNSPKRKDLLEDITATLGRYSRVRHWEHVLIILAGLQQTLQDRVELLLAIVAGSSLAEGEQVFLAVKMYLEMADRKDSRADRAAAADFDPDLVNHKVVRQILDTLIWRSWPDRNRPYIDRSQAVDRLGQMRHPDAIPKLVEIAVCRFHLGEGGAEKFENSNIRMLAVNALLLQLDAALAYVEKHRPDLTDLLRACKPLLAGDTAPMLEILNRADPSHSPVAAFALALLGMEKVGQPLLDCYWRLVEGVPVVPAVSPSPTLTYTDRFNDSSAPAGDDQPVPASDHAEMLWALTEVFSRQESGWLEEQVIRPWMNWDPPPKPERRLCYLIQKLGQAPPGSGIPEYLARCLKEGGPKEQDRALRAYAKLNDPEVNRWLTQICYQLIRADWAALAESDRIGLAERPNAREAWRLQQAALEVLRDIGTEEAIAEIRDSRLNLDPMLFHLSFQVAEQIYWRLSGGLAQESGGAAFARRP